MRVLHLHSGNLYGGVETLMVTMARFREYCPEMESHFALCFEGRLSDELRAANVPVHFLNEAHLRDLPSVWRARRALKNLLLAQHIDVAVCHSSWSHVLFGGVARASKLPLVFWMHGEANGHHWLERLAKRTKPDLVVANSFFTAGTVSRLFAGVKSEVVYCPVAVPQDSYTEDDRAAIRAELNTSDDKVVIIQVSRMEAFKGHKLHLEALSEIADNPNWVCWQVGGAQRPSEIEYAEQVKLLAARLGIADRVRFLGQRADVQRLLAAADVHCQPNLGAEPFGITFIEALYARLPVVTTAIGGAKEIVDDSCGFLVSGSVESYASSFRILIENKSLREQLGSAGPARGAKLCDVQVQMKKIHRTLASV